VRKSRAWHHRPVRRAGRAGAIVVYASIGALLMCHLVAGYALSRVGPPDGTSRRTAYYADIGRDGELLQAEGRPYRDYQVEYPPLVLAEIKAVGGSSSSDLLHRLAWSQLGCELVMLGALAWGWGRKVVLGYLVVSLPLVAFPFVFVRTDMLASALAVAGVAALKKGAATTGGVALALSLFAKVWPVAVAPILLVRRQARSIGAWVAVIFTGAVAWVWWGGWGGPFQVLTFRGADGWQVESVVGSVWHAVSGSTPQLVNGAARVGQTPRLASTLLGALAVSLVALVWHRASLVRDDDRTIFGVAPLVAVCALLVCSPLLSPQYMLWLLPWAAIASVPTTAPSEGAASSAADVSNVSALALGVLTFLATATTSVLYAHYAWVISGQPIGHLLLLTRNLLLLGLLVIGWRTLGRASAPTREPRLGRELVGAPPMALS